MSLNFFLSECQNTSSKKRFGLCDTPPPSSNPAYIDENNGEDWIAVINNEHQLDVTFTAIDNCVEFSRPDGKLSKRCDGMLTYDENLIFVELKQRSAYGSAWVKDAEKQLKATIVQFEETEEAANYIKKKAYIANSEHPKFKISQAARMEKFQEETGYTLRIENRITLA